VAEAGLIISVVLFSLYLQFSEHYESILFRQRGLLKTVFTTVICQFVFYLFDLYNVAAPRSKRELLTDLFRAVGMASLLLGVVFFLRPTLLLGYFEDIEGKARTRRQVSPDRAEAAHQVLSVVQVQQGVGRDEHEVEGAAHVEAPHVATHPLHCYSALVRLVASLGQHVR